jgi:hypothetical protein
MKYRRLASEQLELRAVLSGDVAVGVVNGDLVITGDADPNYVLIEQDANTGDWIVTGGVKPLTNTETLVNGQLTPQTFSGVTGGLIVDTAAGQDRVVVTNADVPGDSSFALGDDFDRLIFTAVPVGGDEFFWLNQGSPVTQSGLVTFQQDLSVDAGGSHDHVGFTNSTRILGDFQFEGGSDDGEDLLFLNGGWGPKLLIQGDFTANLGGGNDQWDIVFLEVGGDLTVTDSSSGVATATSFNETEIQIHNAIVGGAINVTGGPGSTRLEFEHVVASSITVSLGDDHDKFKALDVQTQTFTVDTGAGDDAGEDYLFREQRFLYAIYIEEVHATTSLNVETGSGNDNIFLWEVSAPTVTVSTSDGSDGVVAFGVAATNATFNTGDSPDVIGVYRVVAANLSVLTGGGNEGNGFFGVVVGDCQLSGTLLVDTGDGNDNLLLGSITAASATIVSGGGSDGVIVRFCTVTTAVFNTGDAPDVLGIYDSIFNDLTVLLGTGVDQLWFGNVRTLARAALRGEGGNGQWRRLGSNQLRGLLVSNLTSIVS